MNDLRKVLVASVKNSNRKGCGFGPSDKSSAAPDLMRHGNLDEALTIYNKLHEQWPDDETVSIMRERAQSFVDDADMYQRCYIDGCYIHRSK